MSVKNARQKAEHGRKYGTYHWFGIETCNGTDVTHGFIGNGACFFICFLSKDTILRAVFWLEID